MWGLKGDRLLVHKLPVSFKLHFTEKAQHENYAHLKKIVAILFVSAKVYSDN